MSWQDYIDMELVGRELKEAVIAGHDGNIWAKSSNFNVTPGEIQARPSSTTTAARRVSLHPGSVWEEPSTSTSAEMMKSSEGSKGRAECTTSKTIPEIKNC